MPAPARWGEARLTVGQEHTERRKGSGSVTLRGKRIQWTGLLNGMSEFRGAAGWAPYTFQSRRGHGELLKPLMLQGNTVCQPRVAC